MKKWCSIIAVFVVMLFSVSMPAFAATESEVTADGWVRYTKLNLVTVSYKVNTGQNEEYKTISYDGISLPYGPLYRLVDEDPISEFWVTVSANNIDLETGNSELAIVQPGETVSISWRVKLWMAYRYDQNAFTQVDSSMYSCRIYLDDSYTKYLSPELNATNSQGGTLYYNFTNNTDKPVTLSRITIGVFEGDNLLLDSYGYGFYLGGFQYRLFTNAQQAAQAVADSIDQQTEEIKDTVEQQTEEHRNMFERLGDRISGFFSSLASSIGGFFSSLGDRISGFFSNLTSSIGGFFADLGEKITNGWSGDSSAPDGSDTVTDLGDLEDGLLTNSQEGLDSLSGFFEQTSGFFEMLTDGFGAVRTLFFAVVGVGWFSSLVTVSLAVGLFAFLLGVVPGIVSRLGSNSRRKGE